MSTLSQFFGGGKRKYQEFLTSGTFTPPTGVTVVDVLVVGAGGGGGSGSNGTGNQPGASGGSSQFDSLVAQGGAGGGAYNGTTALGGSGGGPLGGTSASKNGATSGFLVGGGAGNGSGDTGYTGACPGFGVSSIGRGAGGASYGNGTEYTSDTTYPVIGNDATPNSGAGGSSGRFASTGYCGGGGGGEILYRPNLPVVGDVSVIVGAGGAGGTGTTGAHGGNGGSGRVIVSWME